MSAADEHVIVHVPDWDARAKALLLWQQQGKPNLAAFVAALAAGAQFQEELIWSIIVGATTIDGAQGDALDRWGRLLGEHRGGLSLEDYRRFLRLRVRVNNEYPNADNVGTVVREAVLPGVLTLAFGIADGIQYAVNSGADFVSDTVRTHAAGIARDFRPITVWVGITEHVDDRAAFTWEISAIKPAVPVIGSIASPGTARIGRLIYSGRG